MTARRAYGSGSIREKAEGVFALRWRTAADPFTGQAAQRQETFRGTKKAAQVRLAQLVAAAPHKGGSGVTLGGLVDAWRVAADLRPSTLTRYDYALRHVPAALLERRAADITPPMIATLYARLTAGGVGPQSVRKVYGALSSAYRHGVEWGWVDRNPCRGVRPPTIPRRTYVLPTMAQVWAMFDDADARPGPWGPWVRLSVGTGARRGELLALRWCDIDLAAGVVSITASLTNDRERGPTKTVGSERTIALDPETAASLRAWKVRAAERALSVGAAIGAESWVISDDPACARPWHPEVASKRLGRLAKAAGCPGARLHDLRHTHATWLLEHGVTARSVADRMGHRRVTTTLDMYGHVLAGADEAAAATYGDLVRRAQ